MTPANQIPTTRNGKPKNEFSNNVPPALHFLLKFNLQSEEFDELFRSFLSTKEGRTDVLALSGEDGMIFIEIIDNVFRTTRLEAEVHQLAFNILRKLCGKIGYLPESYLLPDEFDLSGLPCASGGFADIRKGVFKGEFVVVKSLRIAEMDNKARIRKHFCKEVSMWRNLSHPNVLKLIGIPDTLEDGRFSMVSEWMANGNITEYVRSNAGNHLKLLADAVEGLRYLHDANIVHGDLKGANILITNDNPVTACLADFGFMTIVHDPNLGMESSKSVASGGTILFMAPELLVPARFGLRRCIPSKEADVYAIGMVIYQVLTGTLPFGELEAVFKVLEGATPLKPANALEIGLSNEMWKLLEDCWQTERTIRPPVKGVLGRVKAAASICDTLSPVWGEPQRYDEPESDSTKFEQLFYDPASSDDEWIDVSHEHIPESYHTSPLTSPPFAVGHPLSQGSTLRNNPVPGSPPLELSDAGLLFTGPAKTNTDALDRGRRLKGPIPDILFGRALDRAHSVPRSYTPGFDAAVQPQPPYDTSNTHWNRRSAESSGSDQILFTDTTLPRPQRASLEKPSVSGLMATSLLLVSDAAALAMVKAKAKDNSIQPPRSESGL